MRFSSVPISAGSRIRTCSCSSVDPAHLDDHHALAADIGQVDEHQRTVLDGPQPWRIPSEPFTFQEDD
jgi:hypothetical protein